VAVITMGVPSTNTSTVVTTSTVSRTVAGVAGAGAQAPSTMLTVMRTEINKNILLRMFLLLKEGTGFDSF
jgi:hypothetical protein